MEDAEAVDRFFEKSMPNADVQPLFDTARELGIGFYPVSYTHLARPAPCARPRTVPPAPRAPAWGAAGGKHRANSPTAMAAA